MRVVVAGGHGAVALRFERLLAERGDAPVGLIRNPDQVDDLREAGVDPVVLDLEEASVDDVAEVVRGSDAVVFAAGAGPGSGIARKDSVDRAAAVLLADAAEQAGVRRYLLLSSMGAGAEPPPGTDEVFAAYLQAKTAAEEEVTARSSLDLTVLRPGGLTDDPGCGQVHLAPEVERSSVSRDDVAAVLVALLDAPGTKGRTLALVDGDVPIAEAVREAASS